MSLLSWLGVGTGPIKEALRHGAIIIDVRTPNEYDQGHLPEAINIPVDRIGVNIERIRAMKRPVIVCCNSGARSNTAKQTLLANGLTQVYNGGNWEKLWRIIRSL